MNIFKEIKKNLKEAFNIEENSMDKYKDLPIEPQILIFTGAGLSEESGLSTFRTGDDGLWNNYKISEVCDATTFLSNKKQVFDFYNERKKQYMNVKPNAAHIAIAEIQKKYGLNNVALYTSNIDNLMEDAGCTNVFHVHGHINKMNCLNCSHEWVVGDGDFEINFKCPNCNLSKQTKPGVIFFHEKAPMYPQLLAQFAKVGIYKNNKPIPVIKIIIGTSLQVIKVEHLQPNRGISILVDPNPCNHKNFSLVVPKTATKGIDDINKFISEHYIY